MFQLNRYDLQSEKVQKDVRICIVSDLHNEPYEEILPFLSQADFLLIPGDIADRYRNRSETGLCFLRDASKILPVFFSFGNHDKSMEDFKTFIKLLRETGAVLLDDQWICHQGLMIGGWSPDYKKEYGNFPYFEETENRFRLLLCHNPKWALHILSNPIDLIVCGHAHGGQVRIGKQGLYSPSQGIFPKYTKGWYFNQKMLVSAGVGNPIRLPRWGNPEEILLLTIHP